jgi:hypothetical protein
MRRCPFTCRPARRWFCALVTTLAFLGGPAVFGSVSAGATAVASPPPTAYAFWNSIGINTHLYYSNTPYADLDEVAARLEQLGVMHIRDGLAPNRPDEIAALNLLASLGIRSDLLLGQPGSDPAPLLEVVRNELEGSVEAIEGPNEYEDSGSGWQARLLPFQQTLYQDVKSILPGVAVVGPSVGGLDLVGSLDYGNIHPYPGGAEPEANVTSQVAQGQTASGDAPIWATETGYHDAVSMVPGSNQPATTDAAQSVYIPRLFASYFAQGIQRTYLYELLDEFSDPSRSNPEADFGLLNFDLTPKPQFYALANMIAAVRDVPNPNPTALNYSVSDSGSSLQKLLLSRADGSWQILLWRADPVNATGQAAGSANVSLQLPFCSTATSEAPSASADIIPLGTATNFDVNVGASLQIVAVKKSAGCGVAVQTNAVVLTASGTKTTASASAADTPGSNTASEPTSGATNSNRKPRKVVAPHGLPGATTSLDRVWGLKTGRVSIEFRVAQHNVSAPRIKHVQVRLPAGFSFARLGHGSAVPASAGTAVANGSTLNVELRRSASTLRIYVSAGAMRESKLERMRESRRRFPGLTTHVTVSGTTMKNATVRLTSKGS